MVSFLGLHCSPAIQLSGKPTSEHESPLSHMQKHMLDPSFYLRPPRLVSNRSQQQVQLGVLTNFKLQPGAHLESAPQKSDVGSGAPDSRYRKYAKGSSDRILRSQIRRLGYGLNK